jgi:hypothetical protein
MRSAARLRRATIRCLKVKEKLRALLSFAVAASVIDACVRQGTALELVTLDAPVRPLRHRT